MLAAAKAQVDSANAEEGSAPPTARVKRALEIDEDSPSQDVSVKRARVGDLENRVLLYGRRGGVVLGLAMVGLGIGWGARYPPLLSQSLTIVPFYLICSRLGCGAFSFWRLTCKIMDGIRICYQYFIDKQFLSSLYIYY